MKNGWVAAGLIAVMAAGGVSAAPKGNPMDSDKDGKVSKKEFLAAREKAAEKADKEFKSAAVEKQFAARDKNKDGFLTGDELKAPPKKEPAPKKKQAPEDDEE